LSKEKIMANKIPTRIYLSEDEMPKYWYNLRADMKEKPDLLLHPGTLNPITAAEMEGIFCKEPVKQELDDTMRLIPIPEGILEFYKAYRPAPLIRAYYLEKELQTPAEIYYKFEGVNTSGSHKLNSAGPQAFYAKEEGLTSLTTETGAGQ
jgi:tryptophan synthase beta chain